MNKDPQPDLDGARRTHSLVGLIILVVILIFLAAFFVSYWRSGDDRGAIRVFGATAGGIGAEEVSRGAHLPDRERSLRAGDPIAFTAG